MVAIRQPSDDKEFWHWEMEKEEMAGGVVSGAEEELDDDSDEEEELELDDDSDELETDEDDSLAEEEEPADEEESAEEEEEAGTAPVPPPPKPGIIVATNFDSAISRLRLDIGVSSSAGTPSRLNLDVWATCKTRTCFCKTWSDSSASFILFPVNLPR